MRAVARGFLARGWFARFAACVVVAGAAVVWLGALVVVLRVLVVVVLLVAVLCCVWLVAGVWVRRPLDWEGPQESVPRLLWARVGLVFGQPVGGGGDAHVREVVEGFAHELGKQQVALEVALADVRSSVDALGADLFGRQERLNADAQWLQRELGCQIKAMRALVERVTKFEHDVSRSSVSPGRPTPQKDRRPDLEAGAPDLGPEGRRRADPEPVRDDARAELDFDAAWHEFETDLRLEKIEEREQMLGELEERLSRRERELAAFAAQTQAQLG